MWSTTSGVRLARAVVDGVGPKVLAPGVFGRPTFSPSGSSVAWVAESTPEGAKADGYWPQAAAKKKEGDDKEEPAVLAGKFALRDARSTGEMLLVHNSQLVAWDWQKQGEEGNGVRVLKTSEVLPEGSLPAGGVGIPTHVSFDGTDDGLIFACHLLPPWQPGLSACLNRPTRLYHLTNLRASGSKEQPTGGAEADAATSKREPARCLTPSLYFAHMPRLSPDASTLAFAARPDPFGSHSTVVELRTMGWDAKVNQYGRGGGELVCPRTNCARDALDNRWLVLCWSVRFSRRARDAHLARQYNSHLSFDRRLDEVYLYRQGRYIWTI